MAHKNDASVCFWIDRRNSQKQRRVMAPLHVHEDAGHPGQQGGGPLQNNLKNEGQGGGEAQGVAGPKKTR
jgi:hypothetical protein